MGQSDIMCCAGKEHHPCSVSAKNVDAESGQEEAIRQIHILWDNRPVLYKNIIVTKEDLTSLH